MKPGVILMMVAAWCLLDGVALRAADLWQTTYSKAAAEAKASNKCMLLDFTGSDWCIWCKKLDAEVFSKPEFAAYAGKNLICIELDFPRSKKLSAELVQQNAALAQKYSIPGYPTVLLLAPDGKLLLTTGYQEGGAASYVRALTKFTARYKPVEANATDRAVTGKSAPAGGAGG